MKRLKWHGAILALIVSLAFVISPVQAHSGDFNEITELRHTEPTSSINDRAVQSEEYSNTWKVTPDMLIVCDPQNELLAKIEPGSVQTYRKLQAQACRLEALNMDTESKSGYLLAMGLSGANKYTGLSGESRMIKVLPVITEVQYVYLKCGKKVASFGPPTCTCGANWRYTYSCVKPKTVYITIPCH